MLLHRVKMAENKILLNHFDYEGHLAKRFKEMLSDDAFADVTLVCSDDKQIQAHRVILSSSSPFFKNIFLKNPHQHPLLYLNGVQYKDMKDVLQFIYTGQVQVAQDDLPNFMKVASQMKIYGLMENVAFKQELIEHDDKSEVNDSYEMDFPDDPIKEEHNLAREKFNCAMCGKEFEHTDDLKKHVLTHKKMKEPRFKCEKCNKMFTTKGALKRHDQGDHEGLRYSCDKCEYTAAQSQSLKFHKINYHPVMLNKI